MKSLSNVSTQVGFCRIIISTNAMSVPAHLSEQRSTFTLLQKPVHPLHLIAAVEGKAE